jgi:hypothetical protein
MIDKVATIILCASVAGMTSCSHPNPVTPIVKVTVLSGRVHSVWLGGDATRTIRDDAKRQTRVVFPAILESRAPTIGGRKYLGLHAEGDNDHIDVLAAQQQKGKEAVVVVVDTSIPILLEVVFERQEGNAKESTSKIEQRDIGSGKHTVIVERENEEGVTESERKRGH